jgi:hypothetical protein
VAVALPLLTGAGWLVELFRTPEPVLAPSFAVAGALLVPLPRARRLGWLLLAVALSAGTYVLAGSWARAYGDVGLAGWVRTWAWLPALLLTTTVLPQVLPHGRPLPGRWRVLAAAGLAFTVLATGAVAATGAAPFGLAPLHRAAAAAAPGGAASLAARVRRADGVQRRQLAWVGYGVAVAVLATFLAPWWLVCVAVLAVPAGLLVAATRYRLYEIDRVVDRTLVGAVLLGLTALGYAALVAWAQAVVGDRSALAPVAATFLVALAFHPAHVRVQRLVDRLLHGRRGDPYALLSRVQRALGDGPTPRAALAAGVEEAARGLRLRGLVVQVPLAEDQTASVGAGDPGRPSTPSRCGCTGDGRDDAAAPRRRLRHPARAAPARGPRRAARRRGLRRPGRRGPRAVPDGAGRGSRGRTTAAAPGPARRARTAAVRGRHDPGHGGVGAAQGRRRPGGSPARGGLLPGREAVRDVRRLVHGLRPPALDDLGLLGALQAGAAALSGPTGPAVQVHGHGDLASLPAATEVAVLRIAQEAVLNAVRHSGAETVRVDVRVRAAEGPAAEGRPVPSGAPADAAAAAAGKQAVLVDVVDDGRGLPDHLVAGVGLASMRERAAELGGRCVVDSDGNGTRVHALLPLGVGA